MKLILEGNKKQVNQIRKELIFRCKRDKVYMSVIEEIETTISDVEIKQVEKVEKPKNKK
jgi:hypothetical protein